MPPEERPEDMHPYLTMLRGDHGLVLRIYVAGGSLLLVFLFAVAVFSLI